MTPGTPGPAPGPAVVPGAAPLAAGTRLLHIGPHKTGSTAVQVALRDAGEALARHDVLYALGNERGYRARRAGWAFGLAGHPAGRELPPQRAWAALATQVRESRHRLTCVSNEDFGRATAEQVRRLAEELGGRLHVVAAARRLDRYLPSQWQQRVRAGDGRGWEDWLRVVLDTDAATDDWDRRNVWFSHDVDALLGRWVDVVGPGAFTLVLLDETDRGQLFATFESLLGLPAGTLRAAPDSSNASLDWAGTELVRAVNELALARGLDHTGRRQLVRQVLPEVAGMSRGSGPSSPPVPAWAVDRLRELSERRVAQVEAWRARGVHVVGEPASMQLPDGVVVAESPLVPPPVDRTVAERVVADALGTTGVPLPD